MGTISLEDDAPPMVRILGVTLRRAAADPELAKVIDRLHGRVALRSTVDPQAATITFDRGAVSIAHGVDPGADVVISADLNTLGHPGAPKPKVRGALMHLRFALGAAKVLDPPVPGGWQGAAADFWTWASDRPTRPSGLRVVCTDDGTELQLGEPGPRVPELHAAAWVLEAIFLGGDHLGAAMIEGRLKVVSDLATLNHLIGLGVDRMLGES